MYKLMIVEDEDIIREGIMKSINWEELGFEVIAALSNGKQALQQIDKTKPDVLLTDVKMPVMDGLELSRIVKKKFDNDIEIVVLSGFSDFEYARVAIKVKVFEYLLKPTNKKKFIATFSKLKEELDKKKTKNEIVKANNTKINEALFKLREEFVSRLIDGEFISLYTLQERIEYLELDILDKYYVIASLTIVADDKKLFKEWGGDKNLIKYAYNNIISELIEVSGKGTVLAKSPKEIIILFAYPTSEKINIIIREILNKAIQYIKKLLFNDETIKMYGGIGQTYKEIMEVSKSYLESKKAMEKRFFNSNEKIFEFTTEDYINIENRFVNNYPTEANKIILEVMDGNSDKLEKLLNVFFERFHSNTSSKLIKSYCYVLCFLISSNLPEFNITFKNSGIENYEEKIDECSTISELNNYVLYTLLNVSEEIKKFKEEEYSYHNKIIEKAKRYIEENYSKNISLEEIGNQVFLSPTYLSFLFKNVTGETYSDYLKRVRIESAKELLLRIDLKVYEIANMVGYTDYKYFTTQFKRNVGMSPREYRDKSKTILKG